MGEITVNAAMTDVRTLAKTPDSNEYTSDGVVENA